MNGFSEHPQKVNALMAVTVTIKERVLHMTKEDITGLELGGRYVFQGALGKI